MEFKTERIGWKLKLSLHLENSCIESTFSAQNWEKGFKSDIEFRIDNIGSKLTNALKSELSVIQRLHVYREIELKTEIFGSKLKRWVQNWNI